MSDSSDPITMFDRIKEIAATIFMSPACLLGFHDYEVVSEISVEDAESIMKQKFILEEQLEEEYVIRAFETTHILKTMKQRMETPLQIKVCMCCGKVHDNIYRYTVKRGMAAGRKYNRMMDARDYFMIYQEGLRQDQEDDGEE